MSSNLSSTSIRYLKLLEAQENEMKDQNRIKNDENLDKTRVISTEYFAGRPVISLERQAETSNAVKKSLEQSSFDFIIDQSHQNMISVLDSSNFSFSSRQKDFLQKEIEDSTVSDTLFDNFDGSPKSKKKRYDSTTEIEPSFNEGFRLKPSETVATEALFNKQLNYSMDDSVFKAKKDEIDVKTSPDVSYNIFDPNDVTDVPENSQELEISKKIPIEPCESYLKDLSDITGSFITESMLPERCRNNQLEKSFLQHEKIVANTFYSSRLITKTSQQEIESFYRVQTYNWDEIAEKLSEMMEPSLDYLQVKFKCGMKEELGNSQQEIVLQDEEDFGCEEIRESIEELEKSFDTPEVGFVASTPKARHSQTVKESFKKSQSKNESEIEVSALIIEESRAKQSTPPPVQASASFHFNLSDLNLENEMKSLRHSEELEALEVPVQPEVNDDILEAMQLEDPILFDSRRSAIIKQIETIFLSLLECIIQQKPLLLHLQTIRTWEDCKMRNEILSQNESCMKRKTISFGNKNSSQSFAVLVTVLCEVYKMLSRNMTCTKRELYYRDVEMFRNQSQVDKAINNICTLLNVQEYELGVMSSSKGLIVGDMIIHLGEEKIDCKTPRSVPQTPSAIISIESNAEFVLIVEKDTVFQRLINDEVFKRVSHRIVLITAKGYPDVNTRMLLKKISTETQLPIYIIVDADPHGVEIMCTYKYGSLLKIQNAEHLAVPSIEWIGIHPTDIENLDVMRMELTEADLKKVDELLQRPYMNPKLKRELKCFKARRFKAEIESIYHYSVEYLINDYIPRKIRLIEMPLLPGVEIDFNDN